MKRLALLLLVVPLAACGGGKDATTKTAGNTAPRNVVKPLERPLVVQIQGKTGGRAQVRRVSNERTSVSLKLTGSLKGLTAELDRGSCGAEQGLRFAKPLGGVTSPQQSWSVDASLTKLTASPLAVVLRSNGKVVGCGNVPQA